MVETASEKLIAVTNGVIKLKEELTAATAGTKEVKSAKTCSELGWKSASGSAVCAHTPKLTKTQCAKAVNYANAEKMCLNIGARLCAASELSSAISVGTKDACDKENLRVWTSGVCAFNNEALTQAARLEGLATTPKKCSAKTESMNVRCCADVAPDFSFKTEIAESKMSCETLRWAVPESSSNKRVCSTALVKKSKENKRKGKMGKGKGRGKMMCSGMTSFENAEQTCADLGGRLCTSDELSMNVAFGGKKCNLDEERVWTATTCPLPNQVLTQAGSGNFLRTIPKKCASTVSGERNLAFSCCADYKFGQEFRNLVTSVGKTFIDIEFDWKAYDYVSVSTKASRRKGKNRRNIWTQLKDTQLKEGHGSVSVDGLEAGVTYSIKLTPVVNGKPVQAQSVVTKTTTPKH